MVVARVYGFKLGLEMDYGLDFCVFVTFSQGSYELWLLFFFWKKTRFNEELKKKAPESLN